MSSKSKDNLLRHVGDLTEKLADMCHNAAYADSTGKPSSIRALKAEIKAFEAEFKEFKQDVSLRYFEITKRKEKLGQVDEDGEALDDTIQE